MPRRQPAASSRRFAAAAWCALVPAVGSNAQIDGGRSSVAGIVVPNVACLTSSVHADVATTTAMPASAAIRRGMAFAITVVDELR